MSARLQQMPMTAAQRHVVETVRHHFGGDGVKAVFIAGSLARGSGDQFSDVDLLAIVEPGTEQAVRARWLALAKAEFFPVLTKISERGFVIVNLINQDWTRIDLVIRPAGPDLNYARADCLPLIDPENFWDSFPVESCRPGPSAMTLEPIVTEFFRILGLLAIVIGRDEVIVGVTGAGLLRDQLIALMVEESREGDPGGALHLSRVLKADQIAALSELPPLMATMPSVLAAHKASAALFLPRARRLAERVGWPWPSAFEEATSKALRAAGFDFNTDKGSDTDAG